MYKIILMTAATATFALTISGCAVSEPEPWKYERLDSMYPPAMREYDRERAEAKRNPTYRIHHNGQTTTIKVIGNSAIIK